MYHLISGNFRVLQIAKSICTHERKRQNQTSEQLQTQKLPARGSATCKQGPHCGGFVENRFVEYSEDQTIMEIICCVLDVSWTCVRLMIISKQMFE